MKTYIIPESDVENYRKTILAVDQTCPEETQIKIALLGLEELELEDAKQKANIGDCLLVQYEKTMMPFQVVDKQIEADGSLSCILQSYYLIEKQPFDQKTNVWRDCSLRKYLNGDFLAKLDPEFVKCLKTEQVHTDNYVTEDKVWIPSHEEIGFVDKEKMFKSNVGAKCYAYYKEDADQAVA